MNIEGLTNTKIFGKNMISCSYVIPIVVSKNQVNYFQNFIAFNNAVFIENEIELNLLKIRITNDSN